MKLAIMQPYFLPYIGYFQLIAAVDMFVVYDNIKYTKKGWFNRNRMLQNGTDAMFSLPLKKDSDALNVVQRELAVNFERDKLLKQFRGAYASAPNFAHTWPVLERIVNCEESNLFRYINRSIGELCAHLDIRTEIRISSDVPIDHSKKSQDKVLAICRALGASRYLNPIGGLELYDRGTFLQHGIELQFFRSTPMEYTQLGMPFVPGLSMIDVMMLNAPDKVRAMVREGYELV